MKVLVLNGSPKGKDSITLQTVLYIEQFCKHTEFEILHVGQLIKKYEKDFSQAEESLKAADLILFCYPVYTFLVPSQLHRFVELIKEHEVPLEGKFATQISTSKHFYDTTAHQFIEDNCNDLGLRYIRGLSADMEDLLSKKGQQQAREFFRYVLWNVKRDSEKGKPESAVNNKYRIAIVADHDTDIDGSLKSMVDGFVEASPIPCDVINIREFPFRGGCLGCFRCAAEGKCIYIDGFDEYLRNNIQTADAIVYAYTIKDHSMGSRFKMFDDRQFCNGHRTVTMGKPVGYLVDGNLSREMNLKILMESRAQVGGNFLAGIACNEDNEGTEDAVNRLAEALVYAIESGYNPPANFYGVGGMKIFRDLIYQMQGLMKEDHRFYKEHGFYDFPQKRKGTIAGMYLVGAMMTNERIRKKIGGNMTEGMLMPYRNVLKKAQNKTEVE